MKTPLRAKHLKLSILCLFLAACSDGGMFLAPADDRAVGRIDLNPWSGTATARLSGDPGEQVLTIHAEAAHEEHLVIMVPFDGPGAYQLAPDQVSLAFTVGGDVLVGRYSGRTFSGGEMQIREFDDDGRVIRADFHLLFEHQQGEQRYGPTAEFTDGHLHARIDVLVPGLSQ